MTKVFGYAGADFFDVKDQKSTNDDTFPAPYEISPGKGKDIISWSDDSNDKGNSRIIIEDFEPKKDLLSVNINDWQNFEIITINGDTYLVNGAINSDSGVSGLFGESPYIMFKNKDLSMKDLNIIAATPDSNNPYWPSAI